MHGVIQKYDDQKQKKIKNIFFHKIDAFITTLKLYKKKYFRKR